MSLLKEILFDTAKQIEDNFFEEHEVDELMNTGLYHSLTLSGWKRFYMMSRYGYLMRQLCTIADRLKPHTFLEIGCGTAGTSIAIRKLELAEYVVGVDLNRVRVEIANKRALWHQIDHYSFYQGDFLHYPEEKRVDLIYSLAAFELITPLQEALKKLVTICNNRTVIVLDMANPFLWNYSGTYLQKETISDMQLFFEQHNYHVKKEYYSFFSAFDYSGLLKRVPTIHKTIRLIISRDSSLL